MNGMLFFIRPQYPSWTDRKTESSETDQEHNRRASRIYNKLGGPIKVRYIYSCQ